LGHRPLAKKRQKKLPGVLSAAVQPESLRMLQREGAAVLERYASSRSPPDHLLYHILKIVPVCGGGSDFMVDGSTCGRAGRRFRRMSFVFFAGGSEEEREDSLLVVVRALLVVSVAGSWSGEADRFRDGEVGANVVRAWTTSAIAARKGFTMAGRSLLWFALCL
jgi:hypothetical protein